MTTQALEARPDSRFTLSPRSFRAKFIMVVGAAVLFDLLLSGGLALWNVQRLSKDATSEVGAGLTTATQEFLKTYVGSTSVRADLVLDRVRGEVDALAGSMQAQIDSPDSREALDAALAGPAATQAPLIYDQKGGWAQNRLAYTPPPLAMLVPRLVAGFNNPLTS